MELAELFADVAADITAEILVEVLAEIAAEISAEVVGRTELKVRVEIQQPEELAEVTSGLGYHLQI